MSLLTITASFFIIAMASRQIGQWFFNAKLPFITGYLFAGVIVGPFVLDIIPKGAIKDLRFIDQISLAVIAFAAGSELHIQELRSRLTDYACIYVLFPEGTRSRDGRMAPFKPGIGMLLAQSNVPVVPCRLSGTFEALPPQRSLPRPRRVRLNIGPPICFANVTNRRTGWEEIAGRLQSQVESLSQDPRP